MEAIGSECECDQDRYTLNLSDYLVKLTPPADVGLKPFDPNGHFITSGDAIQKTIQLQEDLEEYLVQVTESIAEEPQPSAQALEFKELVSTAIANTARMHQDLIKARGSAIFFETEWVQGDNGRQLICIPKNPRPRK